MSRQRLVIGTHEALTAYGLVQFADMKRVTGQGDEEMMARTAKFLEGRRDGKGGYLRDGKALDSFGRASPEVIDAYVTWALTEAGSGSDAAGLATTAVRDGDDWIIDGSKLFITQGSVGGFCVVLARNNHDAPKQRGITAFVVDRGTPGFRASKHLEKLGMRSSDTVELVFEKVRVSDTQRLGEVDAGFLDTMAILDRGRVSIAALAVGLGQGALEQATTYAKDRRQFGHPIGDFQAIQWSLADSRVEIDAARLLTYRAAILADQGKRFSREASMAKLFASEHRPSKPLSAGLRAGGQLFPPMLGVQKDGAG